MKKVLLILTIILFYQAKYTAQSISISKDSLSFFQTESNLDFADTFYIANIGDANLIIDSIKTEHEYGYQVEMKNSDTTFFINLINFEQIDVIILEPQDSFRVIFSNPDLCPICDVSNGVSIFSDTVTFYSNSDINSKYPISIFGDGTTDVKEDNLISTDFILYQNYPNPFNPTTTIMFSIKNSSNVKIIIYDILGNKVKTLIENKYEIGQHEIVFDGSNLSCGFYYYRIIVDNYSKTKKLLLLK